MNDAATVIIAAFAGGLAGAILQPLVSHVMGLRRARHDREKAKQRHLRRVLTAWLQYAADAAILGLFVLQDRSLNRPPLSIEQVYKKLRLDTRPFPTWEGERITAEPLRTKANELYALATKVAIFLSDPSTPDSDLQDYVTTVGQLREEIVRLMDEFEWPEVEE